jgi:CheY-like chemotaxis protein
MKALVVDDDAVLRMLMRDLLEKHSGYQVIEAANGQEAWHILESEPPPDLCIFDVLMPGMNGLDLLAKLRNDPRFRSQRVVLCSSVRSRETVLQAAALEVSAFLIKPFRASEFLQKVPAASDALEPVPQVLERLAITKPVYSKLLTTFIADLEGLLTLLLKAEPESNLQDVQFRLSALTGAGKTLGALAVVNRVAELERSLAERDESGISSGIKALSAQREILVRERDNQLRE